MKILAIIVTDKGVQKIDIFAEGQHDYFEAMEFHRTIAPEIAQLDRAIKEKCK